MITLFTFKGDAELLPIWLNDMESLRWAFLSFSGDENCFHVLMRGDPTYDVCDFPT